MEWQPIAIYDAMKVKPDIAVFFFKAQGRGASYLQEIIKSERHYGSRKCTHFILLPTPPKE